MAVRWSRALVTGASAGIGEAIAKRLARSGTDLVLVARRREALTELATELRTENRVEIEVIRADLTVAGDLERIEARAAADEQPVDLLVNNVGGGLLSPFPSDAIERELGMVQLNVIATLRLTRAVLPRMQRQGRGTILNVSSGTGFQPVPFGAVYGASKAFITSFSEALHEENRRRGVTVTAVCPGFTSTGAQERIGIDSARVPKTWWMTPDQVAEQAVTAAAAGRPVVVPGAVNKVGAVLGRHAPHRLLVPLVARRTRGFALGRQAWSPLEN